MNSSMTRLALFGASPGTGNQGVNALCWSTLEGLTERIEPAWHVFHYGAEPGIQIVPGSQPEVTYRAERMTAGKKFWREDHMWRALNSIGSPEKNTIARIINNADAVLDASGGDSFTDLYGAARFRNIIAPKRLALALGRPLILLPQTYGPFASASNERLASDLISGATLAYARDEDSFDRMRDILGSRFDPVRHRLGVDLAFGLRASRPSQLEPELLRALFHRGNRPLVTLNVSGLLTNEPSEARTRFSLRADYPAVIRKLIENLLKDSDAQVLLLPHVHAPEGHYESDLDACLAVVDQLAEPLRRKARRRVSILTQPYDATELKAIIGQSDWHCGTRMHATIAALSMGVPACALAYSLKTRGVFDTCGMGDSVVDLRHKTSGQALDAIMESWNNRTTLTSTLEQKLPSVVTRSHQQLDEMVDVLRMNKAA